MLSYLLAVEELARGSLAVAAACTMQSLMGTFFVHRHATGDVRERLLGPALRGEVIGTICMTEPDSGSDLFSMSTRAEERDGAWYHQRAEDLDHVGAGRRHVHRVRAHRREGAQHLPRREGGRGL